MGVCVDRVHLLAGQKRLKEKYKDPDVLPKVNKANMVGTIEDIKEYLRSCHGFVRVLLTYIIMKAMLVLTYDDYPKNATPDDKMIANVAPTPRWE